MIIAQTKQRKLDYVPAYIVRTYLVSQIQTKLSKFSTGIPIEILEGLGLVNVKLSCRQKWRKVHGKISETNL